MLPSAQRLPAWRSQNFTVDSSSGVSGFAQSLKGSSRNLFRDHPQDYREYCAS